MASSGDFPSEILLALSKSDPILSREAFPNRTFAEIKAALDKLASRSMVTYQTIENDEASLEPEAEGIVKDGSHEARVFEALRQSVEGLSVQDLEKAVGDKNVAKLGQGKAFKEKWITRTSDGKFKASVSTSNFRRGRDGSTLTACRPTRSRTQQGNSSRLLQGRRPSPTPKSSTI